MPAFLAISSEEDAREKTVAIDEESRRTGVPLRVVLYFRQRAREIRSRSQRPRLGLKPRFFPAAAPPLRFFFGKS